MDLGRAISKHARSPVWGWNTTTSKWEDTLCRGRLQVYDRFITERNFGQKKRILTVGKGSIPAGYNSIKVGSDSTIYMIEHNNHDIRFDDPYALIYSLRETAFHCQVRKEGTAVNAAGVKVATGTPTVLFETWVDIERLSAAPSTKFEETEFTTVTISFPYGSAIDSDCHILLDDGAMYHLDEVYRNLDAIQAKGKRIGL